MRFRRETGDFSIVGTYDETTDTNVYNKIPSGLLMEDLMGVIVEVSGFLGVVKLVAPGNDAGTYTFVATGIPQDWAFTYNVNTGVVENYVDNNVEGEPDIGDIH